MITTLALVLAQATPSITNAGLAVEDALWAFHQSGPWTVFAVSEAGQGADLDGDGLANGHVLFVRDDRDGAVQNLGLAVSRVVQPPLFPRVELVVAGPWAIAREPTSAPGAPQTAWLVDLESGARTSLGDLVFAPLPFFEDGVLTLLLSEQDVGDANGDGDTLDDVLHLWDAGARTLVNLGLAPVNMTAFLPPVEVEGGRLLVSVSEADQGATDLNGDGDALDGVLFLRDLASGATRNLGIAARPVPGAFETGLVQALEIEEGRDLSGDGRADDLCLFALDAAGSLRNLRIHPISPYIGLEPVSGPGRVAITTYEASYGAGTDLTGDGQADAAAVFLWDPCRRELTATGQFGVADGIWLDPAAGEPVVLQAALEADVGVDVNGDGELSETVLALRRSTGLEPTRWTYAAAWWPPEAGPLLTFMVQESAQGEDLTGDGLLNDLVPVWTDVGSGRSAVLAEFTPFQSVLPWPTGRRVYGVRSEALLGQDLNGDGMLLDLVFGALDARTATITNLGVAPALRATSPLTVVLPPAVDGGRAALLVDEALQGGDLNDDGDTFDFVLHVAR